MPNDLVMHHINAVQAIVRQRTKLDTVAMANELSRQLRGIADADQRCAQINMALRLMRFTQAVPESAEAAFARLGRK